MKKLILTLFCTAIFSIINLKSQTTENTVLRGGEELRFIASYNMSGLWTDLAEIKMSIKAVKVNGRNLYRLINTAKTFQQWDSYFKIRDSYQSWVNPKTLLPYIFKRDVYEGGTAFKVDYVFKRKSLTAKAVNTNAEGGKINKLVKITSSTLDLASVLANARKINFEKDKINTIHYFKVLVDNELLTIGLKYRGKESIKVGKYGSKDCYKVGVFLKEQKIMKNNPTNNVWFTADANKVPVLIKAVIPVGSIQVRLVEMNGLRNQ